MRNELIGLSLAVLLGAAVAGCSDNTTTADIKYSYADPGKAVTFADFTPKTGSAATRLYITGSNFGTDPEKIHVTVGGVPAAVIGSDGQRIYSVVQKRSYDGTVNVKVQDAKGDTIQNFTFDSLFQYKPRTVVGTLFRNVDEKGNAGFQEGDYSKASLASSDCLLFDPKYKEGSGEDRLLFSSNYYDGIYQINLTQKNVKRLFDRSQYKCLQSFTFTADGDTMLLPDDNGHGSDYTAPNLYYALRSEGFRKVRPYSYAQCTYAVVSMKNGDKFYGSWEQATIYRQGSSKGTIPFVDDPKSGQTKMFSLSQVTSIWNGHTRMIKHPDEKYVYLWVVQNGCIFRADYDAEHHLLKTPVLVCGSPDQSGFKEGVGGNARISNPWAGCFVLNPDYVKHPRPDGDKYDFVFTGCSSNDCIWKVTPDGVCKLMAGRSNPNADGKTYGYVDGDPLKEARFEQPKGITYDETDDMIYVGDYGSHAVRYITTE